MMVLQPNILKHASANIHVLFSLFYTTAINHGYLPNNFMKTIIVPLVKNKTGDISDVNNYRPIALVTVTSKIFENILWTCYILTSIHRRSTFDDSIYQIYDSL